MNNEINYQNNPLHGLGLNDLLTELVDHYGFEILFAYLNINCFNINPSISSSMKFLKKTDWAREKVEGFYLYQYKHLPRASDEQLLLSPRDRIVPDGQIPDEPAELSLEDADRLHVKRDKEAAAYDERGGKRSRQSVWSAARRGKKAGRQAGTREPRGLGEEAHSPDCSTNPWANTKKKLENDSQG